jgi:hypothetical protein
MDELDLELVARLRPEPVPDPRTVTRHRERLRAAIETAAPSVVPGADPSPAPRAPAAGSTATDSDGCDPRSGVPVILFAEPRTPAGSVSGAGPSPLERTRSRSRRRLLAVAAGVAVAGGLVAMARLAAGPVDETTTETRPGAAPGAGTTRPAAEGGPQCGPELPFTFPAPTGFEGPLPGASGAVPDSPGAVPDPLTLHWRSAEATIDVRWPSSDRFDSLPPAGQLDFVEDPPHAAELRIAQRATFRTLALGDGDCSGLDVTVTAGDTVAAAAILDQVEMALAGPGGRLAPAEPAVPLVTASATAETLPPVSSCTNPESGESLDNVSGAVEGTGTYPTPQEALGFYVSTVPWYPRQGYQEITLPDGSVGYAHRPAPDADVVLVVHVVHESDGWSVAAVDASSC